MKSVALHNLGCKVNGYEVDVMQQKLQENGFEIVSFDEWADIYIVNTCTVTNIADKKSRQMLHKAKKRNPDAIVVAVGCYVQTEQEKVMEDESIDLAIGNNKKGELISILNEYLDKNAGGSLQKSKTLGGETIIDLSKNIPYEDMMLVNTGEHTRAFIKIQDGCNQFCSYCIIPYVRGRVRSRDKTEIIKEIKGLVKIGYKEVVLTGIHISSYGSEKKIANSQKIRKGDLLELIKTIHEIEGLERIRLGSLEPRIINETFAEELSGLTKVCPHFHLSLQSGCDATLKRMNRQYTSWEYYEKVRILRRWYKAPAITTDVIVGFPGETEEEFMETCNFLEKISFYEMHVFKYSKRKGTRAEEMQGQIAEEIKNSRSSALIKLGEKMARQYRNEFLHKELEVLIEENKTICGKSYEIGYTGEYLKIALPSELCRKGNMVKIITESYLDPDILMGTEQTKSRLLSETIGENS